MVPSESFGNQEVGPNESRRCIQVGTAKQSRQWEPRRLDQKSGEVRERRHVDVARFFFIVFWLGVAYLAGVGLFRVFPHRRALNPCKAWRLIGVCILGWSMFDSSSNSFKPISYSGTFSIIAIAAFFGKLELRI